LSLAAGVCELHPNLRAFPLRGGRPCSQRGQLIGVLLALNSYISSVLHMLTVDLHITGQHQARAILGPGAVERLVGRRRAVAGVR